MDAKPASDLFAPRIRRFFLLLALACCFGGSVHTAQTPASPVVLRIQLANEAITPVTARFIIQAIKRAEQEQAAALVLMLDTPGGLVDSTRQIVGAILQSRVPVVVYVAPSGARAASAGVFITMAGHVAAMAPGTTIGAAHPVQVGGGFPGVPQSPPPEQSPQPRQGERQGEEKQSEPRAEPGSRSSSPMEDKILNDTVAWARALAEMRGRNADWAARAVRESISAPASEALKEKAVDLIADDLQALLAEIDGREVALPEGRVKLHVAGAEIRSHHMWWGEQLLSALANPTLAFLLLMFGFYGILFELYTPGWGASGTVGVICIVLGFFALAVLPINYVGLVLIVIALAMFLAEAFVVSYGFLTLGGIICLVMGGLMLVDSPVGFMRIPLWTLIGTATATAGITFFLVGSILRARRAPVQTGAETLSGWTAAADEDFRKEGEIYRGRVLAHGELWSAVSRSPIAAGQPVEIEDRRGLTLNVRPARSSGNESA
ncbi:MAG: nodulation protein NfeD [Acidobacteria bacterium]|nr:nodulation protein NfeD [Acidobacteriota bacterium]MCW5971059.1 nodulation protein NfeD [Blastocatellales bacterium]